MGKNTEGESKTGPYGPAVKINAIDTYEWWGKFFLIHCGDAHIGTEETKGIEIIGYDASSQKYFTQSFDDQSNSFTYEANLCDGIWNVLGDYERL